jgi:uncharacterized membrane protein YjfL (UPF0719 family)
MTFKDFIGTGSTGGILGVFSSVVIPTIFALAFGAFVWGVVNYFFLHGSEETKRKEGREFIFWGIIGMVVLLSVWTFVKLLLSTLGISGGI